jgi:hypothetical protein
MKLKQKSDPLECLFEELNLKKSNYDTYTIILQYLKDSTQNSDGDIVSFQMLFYYFLIYCFIQKYLMKIPAP